MSEGDVPDLASSSDSEVEEKFASSEPQNDAAEVVMLPTQVTDSGLPMRQISNMNPRVGGEASLPEKAQNSGDESESSTDIDNDEDEEEDEDDEDGNEGEDVGAQADDKENHCSRNPEVEDAGGQTITLQQKSEDKLLSCLEQAAIAFVNGDYLSAASEYKLALMMLTKKDVESDHGDKFIIRYCLGLSHINQKYNKEIREGERVFQSIVDESDSAMRVLGYLGLAKAYLKQNRFSEAIQPLQDGLTLISDGVLPGRCLWPGTSKAIVETDNSPTNLKEAFEQLLSECRNPPLPLAVCRYSDCSDPVKTQMYLSDPEFKGYVQVVCIEKCIMEFHRECWREMKAKQLDKCSDKELLSHSCITPDCQSTVCRILVFRPDGKILKTLSVEENLSKTKKPGSKYKNISVQHAKGPAPKKVGGKKAKGTASVEEKPKVVEVDDGSESRIRLGETARHRDDNRTHEGGGGGDGGRAGKTNHRTKSMNVAREIGCQEKAEDVGRRGPENEASVKRVDPLVTMKRTDFVTLQKKKNEEQDSENLSKKTKKKREKEKPKKTTIPLDEFVDKKTNSEDAFELAYQQSIEPNPHSFWAIPPHVSYQEIPSDWNGGACGFSHLESHANRQSDTRDSWDVRTGTMSSQSAADDSEVSRNASEAKDSTASSRTSSCSKPPEEPLEVEEDVKGNIMSYFEMFLEKNGPCLTDEDLVQRELEAFPGSAQIIMSEAGGIANLLLQSVKFTVIDGYICLLKDAAKARLKARERRMALLGGSNFFKRFAGGVPVSKPNSSTVDPVTSSGDNNVSAAVKHDPADEKSKLKSVAATVKKSDELITCAVPVTVCYATVSLCTDEEISSATETTVCSELQKPVADSAVDLSDFRDSDKDSLFGLSDLNEYKYQLQQKNASLPVVAKYDTLDSIEGNSSLSVIEKFKKQVHEAASKERTRARLAQNATSASVSANETSAYYAKSLLGDSKYVASASGIENLLPTTSSGFGSYLFTGDDIKNERDKKFKKAAEPMDKSLEKPYVVSDMLDIEDDVKNAKVAVSVNKTTKSDAYLFSFSGNVENAFKMSSNTLKNSTAIKSTLSATASDFRFPVSSANSRLTNGTISTTAGQKFNPSTSDVLASRTLHGRGMNSLDYDFGNDLPVAISGSALSVPNHEQMVSSGSDLFNVFGNKRQNNGGLLEDKAMNTDQNAFVFGDYDRVKSERDDLSRRYKALAEKQLQTQNRYTEELHIVTEKLNRATNQLENVEKKSSQLENESQLWRREKMIYENELEKLRSDLSYTKASLESANHLVEVTDRLLSETKNALISEQEECRSVRDKYEGLLSQLGRAARDRSEISFGQPSSASSSAHVPVTAESAVRTGNRKPKHGFEKILNMLSLEFPNLSRIELSRCVQEVRVLRNNSLSGLTVQEIVAKVREFILKEQTTKQLKKKNMLDLPYSPPRLTRYNSNNNGTFGGEVFLEEVDPCIICHEELSTEAASMLDCGHSFHTECVRKWFREQSTCPTCRNHALLPDEFPALARTFFA